MFQRGAASLQGNDDNKGKTYELGKRFPGREVHMLSDLDLLESAY